MVVLDSDLDEAKTVDVNKSSVIFQKNNNIICISESKVRRKSLLFFT
jgi:hypothetical protein